jgi:protein-ribulosamine 3-kinase
MPGLVPRPLGWGKYANAHPETYFFIEDFKDMDMSLPNPGQLARQTAELHANLSPNGKFGFDVTTFAGEVPHAKGWEPNWTVFFTRLLELCLEADEKTNGYWHELKLASNQILSIVVPRLLDPLQQGSDPIKPVLIHGDLWSGNIGTDEETGKLVFFDCGCFYAHSELELGMWRCDGAQNLGVRYLREYQKVVGPAKPEAEFDDRNRLYCMKYYLTHSALNPGDIARQTVLNDMAYLCEKYAPLEGIPKYDAKQDPAWKSYTRTV